MVVDEVIGSIGYYVILAEVLCSIESNTSIYHVYFT